MKDEENTRFQMVKERHRHTFFDAVRQKRADKQIIPFCRFLAGTKNFFSSSTCAGRIVLLSVNKKETKKEAAFHAKWHRKVKFSELWKALEQKSVDDLWFKMEPFILHIGTNNIGNAQKFLGVVKSVGIKRGGIQVLKEGKIIFEINGTQHISCPAKEGKKILFSKEYAKKLLGKANTKLEKNYELLKRLEKECGKKLD